MTIENIDELFSLRDIPKRKKCGRKTFKALCSENSYTAKNGNSCLYAIGSEAHRFIKIGRSVTPYVRMYDLQVASPFELKMLCFVEAARAGVVLMETEIHRDLRSNDLKGQGEWWDIERCVVTPLFATAADKLNVDIVNSVGDTSLGYNDFQGRQWQSSFLHDPLRRKRT